MADARHGVGPESQGCVPDHPVGIVLRALEGERPLGAGQVAESQATGGPVELYGDLDDVAALPGQRVEDGDSPSGGVEPDQPGEVGRRAVVHVVGEVVRFAPASQQIEVDLVGLRPGDAVMVGPVDELAPGFV